MTETIKPEYSKTESTWMWAEMIGSRDTSHFVEAVLNQFCFIFIINNVMYQLM